MDGMDYIQKRQKVKFNVGLQKISMTKIPLNGTSPSQSQRSDMFKVHEKLNETIIQDAKNYSSLKEQYSKLLLVIRMQEKEIAKLQELNKSLYYSNQQKLELLHSERKNSNHSTYQTTSLNQSQTKQSLQPLQPLQSLQRHPSVSILSNPTLSPLLQHKRSIRFTKTFFNSEDVVDAKANKDIMNKEKKSKQVLQFLQAEEYFKINSILNMNLRDQETISSYENDGTLQLLDQLLQDEEVFIELIQNSTAQQISSIYDKLKKTQQEHKQFFTMVLRLKKLLQGALQMSQKVLLDDAIQTIMDQVMECLECDRASCFIVDQAKNEICSSVAKGTQQVIRMQIGKGIAGLSVKTKQIINVQNAYFDGRFNSDQDQAQNYKTNTILAVPIIEKDRCIGLLQCVNKKLGVFSKVDEALLVILADFSRIVMNNAINNDEQVIARNRLRYSVKTGLMLNNKTESRKDLLILAQDRLKSLMNVELAKVAILINPGTLIFYNDDAQCIEVESSMGIIGQSISQSKMINIFNCYQHPSFNPVVDLMTSLPVIIMPIYHNLTIIGAIQVANARGIGSVYQNQDPKISFIDQEVLDCFVLQLAQSLNHLTVSNQE